MTVPRGAEVTIEKLVPGGDGFARLEDGRALFVRGAAPGDRIRVLRVEKQRGAWYAAEHELLAPSSERVKPECPIADSCGGCDFMHLSRESELAQKAGMLREALERVGGVELAPGALTVVGPSLGYRSRVRFHVSEQGKLGFFARGTHRSIEVPSCAVADARINDALALIRRAARRFSGALSGFREVELRASPSGVIARFVSRDGIRPVAAEPFLRTLAKDLMVAGTDREAAELSEPRALPGDVVVEIPADAFSQVNVAVNQALVTAVVEGARSRKLESFCDLFAGAGNFALPLARAGLRGAMVERTPSAVLAAERAIAAQGLTAVRTRTADAARALTEFVRHGEHFDLVVLDPPRDGAPAIASDIARLEPRAVAYVACDPVTLARDLKSLLGAGFRVGSVQGFDMFPRTHHFETLVWLEAAP